MGSPENDRADFEEMCTRWSTEMMRPLVKQKEFIYIDADILFDFKLGALISLMRNGEKDYKYILSKLDDYLAAPSLDCARFFPELGLTEEDLTNQMANPKYANVLAAIAPPTRFMAELGEMIRVINTINSSKESSRPLQVTINQRKLPLHKFTKDLLTENIHRADKNTKVEFVEFDSWFNVPKDLLSRQDIICVYDLKEFLAPGSVPQKLLADTNELAMSDILAISQSDLTGADLGLGMLNLRDVMEMFCEKFTFIRKTIMRPEDIANAR